MPAYTITSASAVVMLSIDTVFPTPQRLEQFAVDEAFDTEQIELAETQLGVDGLSSSGWVPRLTTQTYSFMASSISVRIFEDWIAAQDLIKEIYYANATISIPAIKRKYSLRQGTLTRGSAMPNARRVLQARQFTIVWAPGVTAADDV
jgi:hypothetical protein